MNNRHNPDETDRARELAGKKDSSDLQAQAKTIIDRVRTGMISPRMLEVASIYGHPVARLAMPNTEQTPIDSEMGIEIGSNFRAYALSAIGLHNVTWLYPMTQHTLLHALRSCEVILPGVVSIILNTPPPNVVGNRQEQFSAALHIRANHPFSRAMSFLEQTLFYLSSPYARRTDGWHFVRVAASNCFVWCRIGMRDLNIRYELNERYWQQQYLFDVLMGNLVPQQLVQEDDGSLREIQ